MYLLNIKRSLLAIKWWVHLARTQMIQSEIEVIKFCQVRKKLKALDLYWITMIFWCQTKHEIHGLPVIHSCIDKTQNPLYKLLIASLKIPFFLINLVWNFSRFLSIFLFKLSFMVLFYKHIWLCGSAILQSMYGICFYFGG